MSAATIRRPPAPDTFPRWVLWCAGALVAFSLISVGLVRITGNGPDQRARAERGALERELRFEDRPDGAVAVVDGATGRTIAELRGEQGFVRGALRALSRERRARELGPEQPFQLVAHADGRLTLVDPATGKRIDLESFGPQHAGEFARLLSLPGTPPARP
jgi:putative photosynthetic complex assembly protein